MGCHPKPIDELIFFRGIETTNQIHSHIISYLLVSILQTKMGMGQSPGALGTLKIPKIAGEFGWLFPNMVK